MAFDPDKFLEETSTEGQFDPDKFLNETSNVATEESPQPSQGIASHVFNSAMMNFGDEAAGTLAKGVRGTYNAISGEPLDTGFNKIDEETRREMAMRQKYAQEHPFIAAGADITGAIGGMGATGVGKGLIKAGEAASSLVPAMKGASYVKPIVQGVTEGALAGGLYGAGEEGSRLQSAKQGAEIGGILGGGAAGAGEALFPKIQSDFVPLVQKALDKYNIPIARSQVGDSQFANTIDAVAQKVPFSGASAFRRTQQNAFNKAVAKTMGQDSEKLTEDVISKAYDKIGQKFDMALAGNDIKVGENTLSALSNLDNEANRALTGDKYQLINKNINKFLDDVGQDGVINGDKISSFRSQINKIARQNKNNGDVQSYLKDLEDVVIDAMTEGQPENKALLTQAKLQYKNLKTVENLIDANGDIQPSSLYNSVRRNFGDFTRGGGGDLGELARIGQSILKQKVPTSGTAERGAAYIALGSGLVRPLETAAGAASAIGAARTFNTINTSQKMLRNAIKGKGSAAVPAVRNAAASKSSDLLR